MRRLALLALLALALLLPLAAAHGEQAALDEQLVDDGRRLTVGEFKAPQRGGLVVVPYVEGPLPCEGAAGYRIPLTPTSGVAFAANATALQALFDGPASEGGYTAFAVDTQSAQRALILMQENAVALHGLVGVVREGNDTRARSGALGLPYPIPGAAMHEPEHPAEGQGIVMDHDGSFSGAQACPVSEPGHVAITFRFDALPESLGPGKLAHVVALHDPEIAAFLPRPIDDSTAVLQANLYLARPGEDPATIRAALDPSPRVADALPILLLGVGLVWIARR